MDLIVLSSGLRKQTNEQNFLRSIRLVSRLLPLAGYAYPIFSRSTIPTLVQSFVSFSLECHLSPYERGMDDKPT